ncbi:MAG TPA: hypothetical protein VLF40_05820 [Candidatus Saccharimonadales bacterium]|nr:hypothetical protein [Candidatus Saccharimonadales bacterium]
MSNTPSIEVRLLPEIFDAFPSESQERIRSGSLHMSEGDFLYLASHNNPSDPQVGIQEGDSVVVARYTNNASVYEPSRLVRSAHLVDGVELTDASDNQEVPHWFTLITGATEGLVTLGSQTFYAPGELFVPGLAYGVWLTHNRQSKVWDSRTAYHRLLPLSHRVTIRLGDTAIDTEAYRD